MIEQIIDGIWEDIYGANFEGRCVEEVRCRWRIIIRKAIAESQKNTVCQRGQPNCFLNSKGHDVEALYDEDYVESLNKLHSPTCSQAMLEETAVMDR